MRLLSLVALAAFASGAIAAGPAERAADSAQAQRAKPAQQRPAAPQRRPAAAAPNLATLPADPGRLGLQSSSLVVFDLDDDAVVLQRKSDEQNSIASVTKLMTAMVTLDAGLPLDEMLDISNADVDRFKGTHSRLTVGTRLSRRDLLRLALMSSENRAAAALGRTYPGGLQKFVAAMNAKASALGMSRSRFADPAGLQPGNLSTASDLVRMVKAAGRYPLVREFTTSTGQQVRVRGVRQLMEFNNTNRLVRYPTPEWKIALSKTGYTSEAGRCLVMQATVANRPLVFVLLDGSGKFTPIGDANRIRRWVEARRANGGIASK